MSISIVKLIFGAFSVACVHSSVSPELRGQMPVIKYPSGNPTVWRESGRQSQGSTLPSLLSSLASKLLHISVALLTIPILTTTNYGFFGPPFLLGNTTGLGLLLLMLRVLPSELPLLKGGSFTASRLGT